MATCPFKCLRTVAVVGEYTEKIVDLSRDIEAALTMGGEPSTAQKHNLAAKMRRLIESVVNTHVFAGQRHQYKQKSQAVSAFREFTKVVPLLSDEATLLADLYGKLSVSERATRAVRTWIPIRPSSRLATTRSRRSRPRLSVGSSQRRLG